MGSYSYYISKLFVVTTLSFAFFLSPVHAEPPNLTLEKKELKNYHDSGLYQKELTQAIQKAQAYINQQAEIYQKKNQHPKLAIVLDIDETSLSNYKHMVQRDFGGTRLEYHQDVMAANSPAIKPTLNLYKNALIHGIHVFFVTARHETERSATEKNLIKEGYNRWTGLYLLPKNYKFKSNTPFKSHIREKIIHNGYTIIATIGDQYSDLKGGNAKKAFKLPNPFYYLP